MPPKRKSLMSAAAERKRQKLSDDPGTVLRRVGELRRAIRDGAGDRLALVDVDWDGEVRALLRLPRCCSAERPPWTSQLTTSYDSTAVTCAMRLAPLAARRILARCAR